MEQNFVGIPVPMSVTAYLSSCRGNPVGERLRNKRCSGSPNFKGLIVLFPLDTPPKAPSQPSAHPAILPAPPPRGTLKRQHYTFIVFRQVIIFPGAEISELSKSHGCAIMRKMIYCDAMRLSGPVTVPLMLWDNNDAGSPVPVFDPPEAR